MKLTLQPGKADKIHLLIDGVYRMTVDRDFVVLAGIRNNAELDETELADLTGKVNSRRAFQKAAELLSRRDHSTGELLQKLRQRGFDDDAVQQAAERLRELGYLDDRRFAARYAEELAHSKGFGARRIEDELFRKGISREIIRETIEELETPEDGLLALIERKFARKLSTEQDVRRTVNALVRKGYGYSQIKDALETFSARQAQEEAP